MAGLFRRGRIYWARIQRQGREFRRSLQTANRTVAEKRFRQWVGEVEVAASGDRPRRTWQETEARFVREHLTTLKPASAKRYGVSLMNLSEHFGNLMLHQITSSELQSFESKRRATGVTPPTIRRDLACLSSMLTSAIDWEWIDSGQNPVPSYLKRRSKRGLKEAPPRTRYLTEAEEEKLLEATTPAVRQAIILAIDTGLRREELFSLQWHQIDHARSIIFTTTKTKSGRARAVPLPERSRAEVSTAGRHSACPYVLVNPDTQTRYVHMDKGFKAAMRRAGIKDLRWHDLRRTAGCRWLQRDGKSMHEVSMLLGHSSVQVTETRYAFLVGENVAASLSGNKKPGT